MKNIKKNNFFIPKKLAIGFQERQGTYTGKLGYVTYYDNKGIMRKDKSWAGWRNTDIEPLYVDNTPTEGFVLNKSVGGGRGWDARNTWTRVWDPRGFEFEISIENLLWILEWCACSPGKGLEGKFVYGWYGTELILMPTNTEEYKVSSEFSAQMYNKTSFKEKDLVPGTLYKVKGKNDNELVFIGKVITSSFFGKYTKPQLLFISKSTDTVFKYYMPQYNYGYHPGYCGQEYSMRDIIQYKNPSSVIAEITPNFFTQEEIDNYIERFNVSPFSAHFWINIDTVIDKFVTRHQKIAECENIDDIADFTFSGRWNGTVYEKTTVSCSLFNKLFNILNPMIDEDAYENMAIKLANAKYLRSIISEDGKSVDLYNLIEDKNRGNNYVGKIYLYHFATIDIKTGLIKKIVDIGNGTLHTFNKGYSEERIAEFITCNNSDVTEIKQAYESKIPLNLNDGRNLLYYITKNGYVSSMLQVLLQSNTLTFNETEYTTTEWINGAGYMLPIAIK